MKIKILKDIQIGDTLLRKDDIIDDKAINTKVIEALLLLKQAEIFKENYYEFSLKHTNDKGYINVNCCSLCGKCDNGPLMKNCIFYDLSLNLHDKIMLDYISSKQRIEFIKLINNDRESFIKFIKNININDYKEK